ncbi:hypothetical protein SMICM304S_04385 [Streptomyces microflavus]
MKAYGRQLLSGCAAVMEHTWRLRCGQLPAEPYVLSEWFVGEAELWRCVERIASNQGRNWRDRERLLQRVREVADRRLLVKGAGFRRGCPRWTTCWTKRPGTRSTTACRRGSEVSRRLSRSASRR